MRRLRTALSFVLILILAGCAAEKYGGEINSAVQTAKVKDVMLNPALHGRTVNLEGMITTQCASNGCWFILDDGTGQIYINLGPKGFAIPQKTGKTAKVTGVVMQGQEGFQIIAQGVEIR